MTCPVCGEKTRIKDSRSYIDHVIRVRKCRSCGYVFRTVETEEDICRRIKNKEEPKNGEREYF